MPCHTHTNGYRIVTIDYVTSVQPTYAVALHCREQRTGAL